MKYRLTNLIQKLNKQEIRNFKTYSTRYNNGTGERKLFLLFDYIKSGEYDEYDDKLVKILFESGRKNAYYQLKNRLKLEIEYSLLFLNRTRTPQEQFFKSIQLANLFHNKLEFEEAHHYLQEAGEAARELNNYDMVGFTIQKMLELTPVLYDFNFETLLKEYQQNESDRIIAQKQNILLASLRHKIFRTNFSGKNKELLEVLDQSLEELKLQEHHIAHLKFQLKIHNVGREILLVKKDFKGLLEFIRDDYKRFSEQKSFLDKGYQEERIVMLVWQINVLHKLKIFWEAAICIEQLEDEIHQTKQWQFIWTLYLCKVFNKVHTGYNEEGIELLKELKTKYNLNKIPHYNIIIPLNLATLYFNQKDYDSALQYVYDILEHPEFGKLESSLSLSVCIVELIIRIELNDFAFCQNQYAKVRRKYRDYLNHSNFQKEKHFLEILRGIIKNRGSIDIKLKGRIKKFEEEIGEVELGTNEAINYVLWLKSRADKIAYYELLLEIGSKNTI